MVVTSGESERESGLARIIEKKNFIFSNNILSLLENAFSILLL